MNNSRLLILLFSLGFFGFCGLFSVYSSPAVSDSSAGWVISLSSSSISLQSNSALGSSTFSSETSSSSAIVNLPQSSISSTSPSNSSVISSPASSISSSTSSSTQVVNGFHQYTSKDYQRIYESWTPVDTLSRFWPEAVTDNLLIDLRIRNIADNRGYLKRSNALEEKLQEIDGEKLQPVAREAWIKLKEFAKSEKIDLKLVSGYRSVKDQRGVFASGFEPKYRTNDMLSGLLDSKINEVMRRISPPGYSRHHTGYIMDWACGNKSNTEFKDTECYQWVKKDNFIKVRQFGFIPSYPDGIVRQGPNPEEWEFAWVGELAR
jgi:LAS superfamily LD-carboxypeptidase LdcB